MRGQLEDGNVYAFRGKVDGSRDTPSLIVDAIEDVEKMEMHSAQSVHIKLDTNFTSEPQISQLKDFLFDKMGNCSVYFHIDTGKNPFVIKANSQITVSSAPEVLKELRGIPYVKEVWTE
jgi:DNA polymerase-3 subunit alpha